MAINAGNSYIPYVADGLDKAHAAPYKDLLQDARAFSEDCPTIGGTGPGSYRFNDGGLLEVMLGGGWVSACPRVGDLVVDDGVFMEMTGTPEVWTPAEKQTKLSEADLDFLGTGSVTIPATQGPVDLATASDGDVHYNADGTGKLEIFTDGCLKPYPCMSINQCIKLEDGSELVLAAKAPEAWVPKTFDLTAITCGQVEDPVLLAKLKEAIDVRAVGFNFNAATGLAIIEMSDGTDLSTTIAAVISGSYAPNANGVVNVPLAGGGNLQLTGLVSDPDIDIATFAVDGNGDGSFTVTPVLSDGSSLPAFTVGVDDFLSSLNFAADGCTLVGTLDSGATVSVSMCDLVSEVSEVTNADGSITYTHSAGGVDTEWTIRPIRTFVDEDGVAYDPANDPIKVARNPAIGCEVRNGTRYDTFCDGTERASYTDRRSGRVVINLGSQLITQAGPAVGTVLARVCADLEIPDCGRNVEVESAWAANKLAGYQGSAVIRPKVGINGGPTINMATGGQDAVQTVLAAGVTDNPIADDGEYSFWDQRNFNLNQGSNELCFEFVLEVKDVEAGTLQMGIANFEYNFFEEVKK